MAKGTNRQRAVPLSRSGGHEVAYLVVYAALWRAFCAPDGSLDGQSLDLDCDVLIAGAGCGCGEIAAARSAAALGCRVVLADHSGWLGGQLTAQAVPPDEHPWVERADVTASYRQMREAVRDSYRSDPRLREQVRRRAHLNPGGGWVSRLCAEPGVIHLVRQQLLAR
jgi:FAD dependent oxidoreductase